MFTIDSSIMSIVVHLNQEHTLKEIASEIGINDRSLSAALKSAGYRYEERRWIHKDYEDPKREKPISEFIKARPVFNQRQIEKIIQLIDNRLLYDKELNQHHISQDIKSLGMIEKVKMKTKVDKDTLDLFEEYCLENDIDQSEALTLALQNFLKEYR